MTMARATRQKLLLIGYGNTLRGDDGIGALVVRAVVRRHADKVTGCVVPLLTPELCTLFVEQGNVLFVDAGTACAGDGCRLLPIESSGSTAWGTHLASPASLLALAEEVYAVRPRAWCLAVPGEDFRLGARPSALARAGARQAVRIIEAFVCLTSR